MSNPEDRPKIGLLLPTRRLVMTGEQPESIASIITLAETAEQAGLDSVWVGDSLTAKPRLEPLSTLSAVAMRTKRVRLGTSVLLAPLRHPVLLAQTAGTLDLVSEGRAVLAVGVGGAFNESQRREWRNAGVDPRHRASRLEEIVPIVKRLTRGESVTFSGRHFDLDSVNVAPRSPQPHGVPILIACHWRAGRDAQFKRAAEIGDGFISISDYPHEFAMVVEKVREYAESAGKRFDDLEAVFYMTVNLNDDEQQASEEADRFLHLYYGMNMWGDRWGPFGSPGRVVERIAEYVEAGAQTVIVRFASLEQEKQLDRFLSSVLPNL